ncbi:MAG TPA: DUF2252 domain-containing protein [Gaiellaceae bacterium]|nr:DUF2252 domain-containing protein [Gaiellaceae bacterium]
MATKVVPHLTRAEREARGKAARAEVPRSSHAAFEPAAGRPDPVELLEEQAESRVPELVPIRYGRMLVSPFAFYRGGALIMASDLAAAPRSGLTVQLCGDAHLSNFGAFGSPERRLVFDINDFDETLPGPWEWDVKRLVASFAVAGRENGLSEADRRTVVLAAVRAYREAMRTFASMRNLAVWYAYMDIDAAIAEFGSQAGAKQVKRASAAAAKARTRDSMQAFSKLTRIVDGEPRIVGDPPLIVPLRDLADDALRENLSQEMREILRSYRSTLQNDRRQLLEQFRYVDAARKVVGVGSVGTRAWIVLMMGVDGGDPLFLQAKEAQPSVLSWFLGKSRYANEGERVVRGQRLMQAASDIFLGWHRAVRTLDGVERDFYIRQLRDWKASADVQTMAPRGLAIYARLCGWTLARAHARSGDRVAIGAYLGAGDVFDRALAEFAERYADQNEQDYRLLRQAVDDGRLQAVAA